MLSGICKWLFKSDQQYIEEYLSKSKDRADLEYRISRLKRNGYW